MANRRGSSGWRRSGFCDSVTCVEIAILDDEVRMRTTERPEKHLVFSHRQWRGFVQSVRQGDFDQ